MTRIDVYPVGVLHDLIMAWRIITRRRQTPGRRHARIYLRHAAQTVARHVRRRQWHELRQTFNGYLAEPTPWPEGIGLTRCGRGWTRKAAIVSLYRRTLRLRQPVSKADPELWEAILTALRETRR